MIMFGLGTPELMIILIVAFLVFGGKKLPELGAGLGKGISSFKKGLKEPELLD
jgi:sec-independent protein translocase protein TatA